MRCVCLALACLSLAGCGGSPPTLDTTSEESLTVSVRRMADSLSGEEKRQFEAAFLGLSSRAVMKEAFGGKGDPSPTHEMLKPYHGLTATELIARNGEAEARIKANQEPLTEDQLKAFVGD